MNYQSRLTKVKGKRLKRFVEEVKKKRPDAHIDPDWKKWDTSPLIHRESQISTLLGFQHFSEEELKQIYKEVFRLKIIPKIKNLRRVIIICISVLILAVGIYSWLQFQQRPRVYAFGSRVPVFETSDTNRVHSYLNIYGEEIKPDKTASSAFSMLLTGQDNGIYAVKQDNYINWFLHTGKKYFVSGKGIVTDEVEYQTYKTILKELRGTQFLPKLPEEARKIIYTLIQNDKDFFKAVIHCDTGEDADKEYTPFVMTGSFAEGELFIVLKKDDGKFSNLRLIIRNGALVEIKVLTYPNTIFTGPLVFREERENPQQFYPKIRFRLPNSDTSYVCDAPPYEPEYFKKEIKAKNRINSSK